MQITEEENKEYEHTTKEDKSYVRYRVDIWDTKSTIAGHLKMLNSARTKGRYFLVSPVGEVALWATSWLVSM